MHIKSGALMRMAPAGGKVVCGAENWYKGVKLSSLLRNLSVLKARLYEVPVKPLAECLCNTCGGCIPLSGNMNL